MDAKMQKEFIDMTKDMSEEEFNAYYNSLTPDEQSEVHSLLDYEEPEPEKSWGDKALDTVAKGFEYYDRYSPLGAPLRSGVGALQDEDPETGFFDAYGEQYGKPSIEAPTGKDIVSKMGLSEEENVAVFPRPQAHWQGGDPYYRASPAGLVGGAAEAVLDPMNFFSFGASGAVKKGVGSAARNLAEKGAKEYAEKAGERGLWALSGRNKRLHGIARGKGEYPEIRKSLLEKLPGEKKPILRYGEEPSQEVLDRVVGARQKTGQQIGEIYDKVGGGKPVTTGSELGENIVDQAIKASGGVETEGNVALVDRMIKAAEREAARGDLSMRDLQDIKKTFDFDEKSFLDPEKARFGSEMNRAVESSLRGQVEKRAPEMMGPLKELKGRYGALKTSAGALEKNLDAMRTNAMFSLFDRMAGVGGGTAALGHSLMTGADALPALLATTGAATLGTLMSKVLRSYGPTASAKYAHTMAKLLEKSPDVFGPYYNVLADGARAGATGLAARHHFLFNNDPEYRAIFEQEGEQ